MIRYFGITDTGLKRPHNEDSFRTEALRSGSGKRLTLLAVADGVGGANAGEVASSLACTALVEELKAALRDQDSLEARFTSQLLRSAVATSNEVVWKKAQEGGGLTGMATTLCACLLHGSEGVVANVGDSRAYLITGSAKRITLDHSLREEWMMKRGTDPAIGNEPPPDNIITRALGVESTVQVDTFRVSIPPGGILLVCSDGVTKVVSDDELGALALGQTGAKAVCRSLVRKANERGGPDNITIIAATRSFR